MIIGKNRHSKAVVHRAVIQAWCCVFEAKKLTTCVVYIIFTFLRIMYVGYARRLFTYVGYVRRI